MKSRIALLLAPLALLLMGFGVAKPAPTDDQVLLQADEVDYDVDHHIVRAQGHVEIDYGGRVLLSDSVAYNQDTDQMTADGHVSVMAENGDVAFANHVVLTDKLRNGALSGFAALIGKNGRLVAATAQREGGVKTTAYHTAYTPCKICRERGDRTPLWSVHAYRVIYDEAKHKIHFKNATIDFFGVPIFYTPYYSQPDPTVKHASGILVPEVGSSSFVGYFAKVPIYVALSDSEDLTITPFVTTKGGEVLETEYRRRWNDGGMWLQGSVAHNANGGLLGNVEQVYGHLFGAGDWSIDNTWSAGYDIQLTSNDTYMKRYDISQLDRLVNDVFIQGVSGRSRFSLSSYYFEGLRATDDSKIIPFALPLIEYSYVPEHHVLGGQVQLDLSSVSLYRQEDTLGLPHADERVTAEVRYRLPFITDAGQLITFQADARGDVYHVGTFAPVLTKGKFVSRGLPYLAIDWRWPFVSGSGNRSFVIEPIAQAIWAPYGGNPKSIPNEDTTSFEFSEQDLFSFDRLPGFDLVETGPRANIGLRADAYFPGGSVEGLLGEVLRIKPDPLFSLDSGLNGTTSDLVGRVSIKFPPYIDLTHRIDIDQTNGTIRRNEVYLTGIYGRSSLQVSYVRLAPRPSIGLTAREEINAQATIGVLDHWELFAAGRRDLLLDQMLDSEFGLGYEDECLGIALAYRRRFTVDRDLPRSTAILLRFSLKTGDQPYEPFSLFPKDVFSRP